MDKSTHNPEYDGLFDISSGYDQPVFTGSDGYLLNCEYCRRLKNNNSDVLMREFIAAGGARCTVVSVDGMCDKQLVERCIILAARRFSKLSDMNKFSSDDPKEQVIASSELAVEKSLSKGYVSVLTGDAMLIIEGFDAVFICGYRAIDSRSVGESPNEGTVRGPHESFTENLRTNTALIRRRISDPNLSIESLSVGQRSHTSVALCYINGLTQPKLVNDIRRRINGINIDAINDSGELEQLLEPQPNNLFPQIGGSEMPDTVARDICNGRVAVIVNGSPYVLLLPSTVSSLMHVSEDDYQRWSFASYIKLLRWVAVIIAIIGPAFYVALVSYHPGLLPTDLMLITAKNRVNVPFSAFIEVLMIEFVLEMLREAAIRMPKNIGTALSIVGGLIIGDAAIKAGLISPLLIIIIGMTTMASFTIPSYSLASSFRLIKYFVLILSAVLGMPGLTIGVVLTITLMVSTDSFGTCFTAPFTPLRKRSAIEGLIELPARMRRKRPEFFDPIDEIRFDRAGKSS